MLVSQITSFPKKALVSDHELLRGYPENSGQKSPTQHSG
jgi:hypothetical protein